MPRFSRESEAILAELHPDLQEIYREAIKIFDFKMLDGARTPAEQIKNVEKGVSKTLASKHLPGADGYSHAADRMPWPVAWGPVTKGLEALKRADPTMETARAYILVGVIAGIAHMKGIQIRQGADWDGDEDLAEHSFTDIPHDELVNPRKVPKKP